MTQPTGGYVGSILILNLTDSSYEVISTEPYYQWGGGNGMATALFWDYCQDKTVAAFDEKNVVVIATSPFSGTPAPSGASRMDLVGIGSYSDPEWFTRSSMGGRMSTMLKCAGYDALVITGKAPEHTWVNIVNDRVEFKSAEGLWGLDTTETQLAIWDEVMEGTPDGEWFELTDYRDGGRTTQKPSILCIGPASENLARVGTITSDGAHSAGQSGLGAVWGSKNLKAISCLGTGSVPVADPMALLDLRVEYQKQFTYNVDDPVLENPFPDATAFDGTMFDHVTRQPGADGASWHSRDLLTRPYGCVGCVRNCRHNFDDGFANGAMCAASQYYLVADKKEDMLYAAGMLNKLGINGFERSVLSYCLDLYKMGVLGPGKQIDSNIPFDKYGSREFVEEMLFAIAYRTDIGADLADGTTRAIKKWGRWEEDSKSGLIKYPQWGYREHYEARAETDWSYGSLFSERDMNCHSFNWHVHWMPTACDMVGMDPLLSAEEVVTLMSEATGLDKASFDYSDEGIYTDDRLKGVAWIMHYGRFWLNSIGLCDSVWPQLISYESADGTHTGSSPSFEPRMYKAVTGMDMSLEDGLELGKKIFTLARAIWCLEGRTPEMEVFANYVYDVPVDSDYWLIECKDGQWQYTTCHGRTLDREKFESVKPRFYELEGWNAETGVPTRETLEGYGLTDVADTLEAAGKL